VKYQALIHLTYYMVHPLMLAVTLLSIPVFELRAQDLSLPLSWGVGLACSVMTFGPISLLVYAQYVLHRQWWRRIWQLPSLMLIAIGVALSTSLAVLGAFRGKDREFIRTPKFGIESTGGTWRGKAYVERRSWDAVLEIGLGSYSTYGLWHAWQHGQYGMLPFLVLYTVGLLVMGAMTLLHSTAYRMVPPSTPERERD
jgi:hypothetical protein